MGEDQRRLANVAGTLYLSSFLGGLYICYFDMYTLHTRGELVGRWSHWLFFFKEGLLRD